ncbi:hypothetical protein GGS23DRAFT_73723 [Durotheca rogersii]|uniref:uncharacterized protein n=1 Tax=Durotheca rogersii TaxID=419775 RepID=UPI00221E8564|nr:uncharacterized protein GGS23DRAFT_73723 [Durotheca rogersii]KAI5862884.1 hypothetical protein GGS23DRAFT_73723 [Durotheca rogersii]
MLHLEDLTPTPRVGFLDRSRTARADYRNPALRGKKKEKTTTSSKGICYVTILFLPRYMEICEVGISSWVSASCLPTYTRELPRLCEVNLPLSIRRANVHIRHANIPPRTLYLLIRDFKPVPRYLSVPSRPPPCRHRAPRHSISDGDHKSGGLHIPHAYKSPLGGLQVSSFSNARNSRKCRNWPRWFGVTCHLVAVPLLNNEYQVGM